ncbi:MAG: hypothetical protein ACRYFU_25195 [Janthinobacterium lividum]
MLRGVAQEERAGYEEAGTEAAQEQDGVPVGGLNRWWCGAGAVQALGTALRVSIPDDQQEGKDYQEQRDWMLTYPTPEPQTGSSAKDGRSPAGGGRRPSGH